jgi:hypothetical protein
MGRGVIAIMSASRLVTSFKAINEYLPGKATGQIVGELSELFYTKLELIDDYFSRST